MRLLLAATLLCLALLGGARIAAAHEVRPAYLEITERADGRADVLWKHPSQGEMAVALRPRIDDLLDRKPDELRSENSFSLARWHGLDLHGNGLAGRTVSVDGLEQTITDTLLVVHLANGDTVQELLTPARPSLLIDARQGASVPAYLRLGVEHILTGFDHLLFVFGLILLTPSLSSLLRTITAFTAAHSITLALTALKLIEVNPALVEAMVALSILFLAVELVRKARGEHGLTLRYPWIIAFAFGLLHGTAFAGALREIGLPAGNIPAALLLFNVGVEIGQFLFVAAVLGVFALARQVRLPAAAPRLAYTAATYLIGTLSTVWFLERLQASLAVVA